MLVPADVALLLYKAYTALPHMEYCSPPLLGIDKTLNSQLESANYYALKTLLSIGNSSDYNSTLSIANMQSLEYRRYDQSHILLFKCILRKLGLAIFLTYLSIVSLITI